MSNPEEKQKDLHEAVDALFAWLETPQEHLNSVSRKGTIEMMLIGFAEKVRAKEARKAWGQSVMLWGSIAALAFTLGPKVIDVVKIALGVPQ